MATTLTAEQRSQRARIAALTRWSKEDPAATAARGQAGLRAKFLAAVDAEFPGLPDAERHRRAEAAFKAHFARMAFASAKARARKPPADQDGRA